MSLMCAKGVIPAPKRPRRYRSHEANRIEAARGPHRHDDGAGSGDGRHAEGAPAIAKLSPEARKAGMADAPALVAAASLPCKVTDARLIGKAPPDKKTGSAGSTPI